MTDEELIARIYLAMGLTTGDLAEAIVQAYLDDWQTVYPDNDCLVLHNTVVSLYEYLARSSAAEASGGGKSREKEGNVEYEVSNYDKSNDWQKALDSYLNSPWTAFPTCRTELSGGITGRAKVGGVHEDEIEAINTDPNQRNGGADELIGVKRGSLWYKARNIPTGYTLSNR